MRRRGAAIAALGALLSACSDEPLGPGAGGGPAGSVVSSAQSSAASSSAAGGEDGGPCASCAEAFAHPFEDPPVCAAEAAALDALRKCGCFTCFDVCGPFCTEAVPSGLDACVMCLKKSCDGAAAACPGL